MIKKSELTRAGVFTKTHGIHGELNAVLEIDSDFMNSAQYVVCLIEGIPTPFFIRSYRPKGSQSSLILLEDVNSEAEARLFAGHEFYVGKKEYLEYIEANPDEEGTFASDLIGWTVVNYQDGRELGKIADVNLSTANPLFILDTEKDKIPIMIPIAEDFIVEVEEENNRIIMNLPDGLIDLNIK